METAALATAETELLERIQKKLKLKKIPERIECFDNSNISGTEAVAGMAVFVKGRPDTSSYRRTAAPLAADAHYSRHLAS